MALRLVSIVVYGKICSAARRPAPPRVRPTKATMSACDDFFVFDGERFGPAALGAALGGADEDAVVSVDVEGGVLSWPQSSSAAVVARRASGREHRLYVKKTLSQDGKAAGDARRDLASNRVEARFYAEFAPALGGVAPAAHVVVDRVDLDRADGGILLVLDRCDAPQTSPLDEAGARRALGLLAAFHGASMGDAALLARAARRLHASPGTWSWALRGGKEALEATVARWPAFLAAFRASDPDLLTAPRVEALARRLAAVAEAVAEALRVAGDARWATLVHGDAKAMNMFLGDGKLIDFQWVGVGYGMQDVAFHLIHSVAPAALDSGGEARLVAAYVDALDLGPDLGPAYAAVALDHYELSVLDYARHLFAGFPTDSSDAAFAAKRARLNAGLIYRDPAASLRLVRRVDEILARRFPDAAN